MNVYGNFQDAYLDTLDDILEKDSYQVSPRGFRSLELVGTGFRIDNPLDRLITHPSRRSNLVFNFAEALWYLTGRDDLAYLSYYAPSVRRYSSDGLRLTGTAYGPRISRYGATGIDQWDAVLAQLRADPDSKRAVIQIYQAEELQIPDNIDVACTLALQFLLREGRLHAVGYMRANDAYRGMVSDVFSFTFLQEVMARQLGVSVGAYTHMVGSIHVYDPDLPAASELLATENTEESGPMPPIPDGDVRGDIMRLMALEHQLRTNARRLAPEDIGNLELPHYWCEVAVLLELHRRVKYNETADAGTISDLLNWINPRYRQLMTKRFSVLDREASHA
jgi:thymidylate synthase